MADGISTFGVKMTPDPVGRAAVEADFRGISKAAVETSTVVDASAAKTTASIGRMAVASTAAHRTVATGAASAGAAALASGAAAEKSVSGFEKMAGAFARTSTGALMLLRGFGPLGGGATELAERFERGAVRLEKMAYNASQAVTAQSLLDKAFREGTISAATMEAAMARFVEREAAATAASKEFALAQTAQKEAQQAVSELNAAIAAQRLTVRDVASGSPREAQEQRILNEMLRAQVTESAAAREATVSLQAARAKLTAENKALAESEALINESTAATGVGFASTAAVIAGLVAGLVVLAAGFEAVKHSIEFVKDSIHAAGEEQALEVSLKQIIGNADVAKEKFEELHAFWKSSGIFGEKDLADAERFLSLIGTGSDNLTERMETLASVAAATGESVTRVAGDYQKVREAIIRGTDIPLRGGGSAGLLAFVRALQDETGKTEDEIQKMFKTHQIGIELVNKALQDATTGTGRFANAIENQQNTWAGSIARLKTEWESIKESFGRPLVVALTPALEEVREKLVTLEPNFEAAGQWMTNLVNKWIDAVHNSRLGDELANELSSAVEHGLDIAAKAGSDYISNKLFPSLVEKAKAEGPIYFTVDFQIAWDKLKGIPQAIADGMKQGASGPFTTNTHGAGSSWDSDRPNLGSYFGAPDFTEPFPGLLTPDHPGPNIDTSGYNRDDTHTGYMGDMPKKSKSSGGAPGYTDVKTDMDILNDYWTQVQQIESGVSDATERQRREMELAVSTSKELYNPEKFQPYVSGLGEQLTLMQQLIAAEAERERAGKIADLSIQLGMASTADAIERGIQKIKESFGTWQQAIVRTTGQIYDALVNNVSGGLSDIMSGTKGVAAGFRDMALSVIKDIENIIIKLMIEYAIQTLLGGLGGGSLIGNMQLLTNSVPKAIPVGHEGMIVGGSSLSRMMMNAGAWMTAPRFHTGGILPGEVPIIAKRGEGIFTPDQMRSLAPVSSSSRTQNNITVNVTYTDGQKVSQQTQGDRDQNASAMARTLTKAMDDHMTNHLRHNGLVERK